MDIQDKYPINPFRGVSVWLTCYVLGYGPSVFVVETIVAVLIVLRVPVSVPVVFLYLVFRGVRLVTEFCQVADCKRYSGSKTIRMFGCFSLKSITPHTS
jgi:hypothetical protein